ncbi:Dihydrolipoamide acetyltransferase component of pyruvate dehydrogenase complex OS=Streptomyces alboniger OX=132473 GN=CP975_18095 PE=3 SV=1 [Streptomyces alboniger]
MTTMTEASVREFKMPDVGEGLTEAEILKWYVQPGDTVTDGQVVCEVETAKAAVELPIPYDGVVRELRFAEGATVDVGTAIIAVDVAGGAAPTEASAPVEAPDSVQKPTAQKPAVQKSGERKAEEKSPAGSGRQPVLVGYGVATSSTKRRPRKGPEIPVREAPTVTQAELNGHGTTAPVKPRPLAKPPVRKLAKDLGVDLATVVPSGPHGIITREDVHAAVAPAPVPEPVVETTGGVQAPAPAPTYDTARETRVPVKGVRKATAAAMVGSAFTAPHVTEFVTGIEVIRDVVYNHTAEGNPTWARRCPSGASTTRSTTG